MPDRTPRSRREFWEVRPRLEFTGGVGQLGRWLEMRRGVRTILIVVFLIAAAFAVFRIRVAHQQREAEAALRAVILTTISGKEPIKITVPEFPDIDPADLRPEFEIRFVDRSWGGTWEFVVDFPTGKSYYFDLQPLPGARWNVLTIMRRKTEANKPVPFR